MIQSWWGGYFLIPDMILMIIVIEELIIMKIFIHVWLWSIFREKNDENNIRDINDKKKF